MLRRVVLRHMAPLLLASMLPLGGCMGPTPEPEDALQQAFPKEASQVLETGAGMIPTEEGFLAGTGVGWHVATATVVLPRGASEAIRFRFGEKHEVRLREVGLEGEARQAGRALVYRREGGGSFWAAIPGGVESWALIDGDHGRAGTPAVAWEVEGATLQEEGDAIVMVDASGAPRVRVTAPAARAVGGQAVTTRLMAHGDRIELSVDTNGETVLVDPVWVATSTPMTAYRSRHTATRLPNGWVLIAGGRNPTVLKSAELFDPNTNTFSATNPMAFARRQHTATLLKDGRVLVVGGYDPNVQLASAEIFNPANNSWSSAGSMATARYIHTATLLNDGRVLVVAGNGPGGTLDSTEIYTPVPPGMGTGTWTAGPPLLACPTGDSSPPPTGQRERHTATLLSDGRVLVVGGYFGVYVGLESALLYTPAPAPGIGSWACAAHTALPHESHTATLLPGPSDRVLVVGYGAPNDLNEIYDVGTDTWTYAPSVPYQQPTHHVAQLLPNGLVLVSGGIVNSTSTVQSSIYDPSNNSWSTSTIAMNAAHAYHAGALLLDGRVLVTGSENSYSDAADLYTGAPIGSPCTTNDICLSGFCVDGVCCATACNAGACDACSVAAGAASDGTCALLSGNSCDDGNACTQTDTCQAGVCTGGNVMVCPPVNECMDGACNPATGACGGTPKPNGTPCDDGSVCTQTDSCVGGVCTGGNPILCSAPDACHAGVCDPMTGSCSTEPKPDGAPCDDGNACTQSDTCQAGSCTGAMPVVCQALDSCHNPGTCNPAAGGCSNPAKPEGSSCEDDDPCTDGETCGAGVCAGGIPKSCAPLDECHEAGTCDRATGACSAPLKPSGTPCTGGVCTSGICVPDYVPTATTSSGEGGAAPEDVSVEGCSCRAAGGAPRHAAWAGLSALLLLYARRRAAPSAARGRRSTSPRHPG